MRGTTKPESEISDLKPEQQKVLEDIYQLHEEGHYSEADLVLAAQMFDTPEKFKLLRKIFGVLSHTERGLTIVSPQSLVDAPITELHKYAVETAVNELADQKIRSSLFSFYRILRSKLASDKKAEFEKANQDEFDEEKRKAEFEAENPVGEDLGENL